MLDNQTKLNFAVIRFAGFVSKLLLSPNESDVLEYHSIVELFEECCARDLSQFKIAADRGKPVVHGAGMAPLYGWQPRYPKYNSVDFGYFRGQVRGLIAYLVTVL